MFLFASTLVLVAHSAAMDPVLRAAEIYSELSDLDLRVSGMFPKDLEPADIDRWFEALISVQEEAQRSATLLREAQQFIPLHVEEDAQLSHYVREITALNASIQMYLTLCQAEYHSAFVSFYSDLERLDRSERSQIFKQIQTAVESAEKAAADCERFAVIAPKQKAVILRRTIAAFKRAQDELERAESVFEWLEAGSPVSAENPEPGSGGGGVQRRGSFIGSDSRSFSKALKSLRASKNGKAASED